MFRAHVLIMRRSKLHYTSSVIIISIGVMIPKRQKIQNDVCSSRKCGGKWGKHLTAGAMIILNACQRGMLPCGENGISLFGALTGLQYSDDGSFRNEHTFLFLTYLTNYLSTKHWIQSTHNFLPKCLGTPGVPSSGNPYVNTSSASDLAHCILHRCTVVSIQIHHHLTNC